MAKPEIIQWVEENTGITECSFYQTMGYEAYRAAFYSFFTGQFWLTGGLALVGRAAELTAEAAGCNKPAPPPAGSDNCWKVATCEDIWTLNGSPWYVYGIQGTEILSFINCEGVETTYKSGSPVQWSTGCVPKCALRGQGASTATRATAARNPDCGSCYPHHVRRVQLDDSGI